MKIAVLGMPDNAATPRLLEELHNQNVEIHSVIYWETSWKQDWNRLKRKLKSAGVIATLERGIRAGKYKLLNKSKTKQQKNITLSDILLSPTWKSFYVPEHNSPECIDIIKNEDIDIVILATDAIVRTSIIRAPKIAVLNGHPGHSPQFRGLGSIFFQLRKGCIPSMTVHVVDEGIDTGPVLARESIEIGQCKDMNTIDEAITVLRAKMFSKVINDFKSKDFSFIDTFLEPSNMTRGIPPQLRGSLDLKRDQLN